jgi:hypothetical protein
VKQQTIRSDQAVYKLQEDDTYIRVIAINAESRIYLNPITRYDGKNEKAFLSAMQLPKENKLQTWLFRACIAGFMYFLLRGIWLLWGPKNRKC